MLFVVVFLWGSGFIGNPGYGGRNATEPALRETTSRTVPPVRNGESRNFADLANRVERLEKSSGQAHPPANDSALVSRLTSAENASKTFADDLAGVNRRIDELATAVRELRTRLDAATPIDKSDFEAMSSRVAALEKATGTMESEIGKRATVTSDRAVRLALATSALRAAVERGEPFGSELAAAKPLAPEHTFAALEPFAASGVPSGAMLARELAALIPALRNAANAASADSGFFDRLKLSASRLVRVRPVEDSGSDEPSAVIGRLEARATAVDIGGALVDLARLPPAVRAPAQSWIDKAEARIRAITASRQLAADAIGALGKAVP